MYVIVRRDNGHETAVKENDNVGWSSNNMVLWLGIDKIETLLSGVENDQC
jgi:hypothetical protein